ncbi:hypothetical protein [Parathermosynechococcus lividus]
MSLLTPDQKTPAPDHSQGLDYLVAPVVETAAQAELAVERAAQVAQVVETVVQVELAAAQVEAGEQRWNR